jgi:hypothetical protein
MHPDNSVSSPENRIDCPPIFGKIGLFAVKYFTCEVL